MDEQQRAAYVQAMAACALIEAMGMQAENQRRAVDNEIPAYGKWDFDALLDKYGIGHNAVLTTFQGR